MKSTKWCVFIASAFIAIAISSILFISELIFMVQFIDPKKIEHISVTGPGTRDPVSGEVRTLELDDKQSEAVAACLNRRVSSGADEYIKGVAMYRINMKTTDRKEVGVNIIHFRDSDRAKVVPASQSNFPEFWIKERDLRIALGLPLTH